MGSPEPPLERVTAAKAGRLKVVSPCPPATHSAWAKPVKCALHNYVHSPGITQEPIRRSCHESAAPNRSCLQARWGSASAGKGSSSIARLQLEGAGPKPVPLFPPRHQLMRWLFVHDSTRAGPIDNRLPTCRIGAIVPSRRSILATPPSPDGRKCPNDCASASRSENRRLSE